MLIRTAILLTVVTLLGCDAPRTPESKSTVPTMNTDLPLAQSAFAVSDVFYIKPPIDSVIATGVVESGTFRVGDSIIVGDGLASSIGKIETIDRGEIAEASAGENVAFHLTGIESGQVKSGDKIVASTQE